MGIGSCGLIKYIKPFLNMLRTLGMCYMFENTCSPNWIRPDTYMGIGGRLGTVHSLLTLYVYTLCSIL